MTPDRSDNDKRSHRKRVDLRRNRAPSTRRKHWTDLYRQGHERKLDEQTPTTERVGKSDLTRRRTLIEAEPGLPGPADGQQLKTGTVLLMRGYFVDVDIDGRPRRCVMRGMLRKRLREEHNAVTVGDKVDVTAVEAAGAGEDKPEGVIESVQPRKSVLARSHEGRLQATAANVDQAIIVSAIQMPEIRPHLIDRYIVAAEAGGIRPVICINKADLDPEDFVEEYLDVYRSIGYAGVGTSVVDRRGIDELREILKGKTSVVVGMSGVGKSSLLNAVQPGLGLKIGDINIVLKRGRHTTTAAQLLKLDFGGYVVDTPGIRQMELPDIDPGDLEMYFVEFVPLVAKCKFANCTHIPETGCAIKQAVEEGRIAPERYESYVKMFADELAKAREERHRA